MKTGLFLWITAVSMTGYSLFANLDNRWLVMPPVWVMFLLMLLSFILIYREQRRGRVIALIGSGMTMLILLTGMMLISLVSSTGAREHVKTVESPHGNYDVKVYRINPGATGGFRILGELHGPLWFKKRIYNQEREEDIPVRWENEHTVVFGELPLNLEEGETHGYGQ